MGDATNREATPPLLARIIRLLVPPPLEQESALSSSYQEHHLLVALGAVCDSIHSRPSSAIAPVDAVVVAVPIARYPNLLGPTNGHDGCAGDVRVELGAC